MGQLKYCFEQEYVEKILNGMKRQGLAVIDSGSIPARTIRAAVDRGVFVYDYLNAGALERERSFYAKFKDLRLAEYEGWPGEYWVDPTSARWKQHLVEEAKKKKAKGAIGLYFDNADIYWMCLEGFREQDSTMLRSAPSADAVYKAMLDVITTIVMDLGLIVMPNGADAFVRKLFKDGRGKALIRTINQEGCLYEDFKKQSSSERKYRTAYMDWAKKQGLYVRGIEYVKSASGILNAKAYYRKHGWPGLYISKHKNLEGD
jgi:endo-alpha-1,4-polygalactosaminidase (GH114 family)